MITRRALSLVASLVISGCEQKQLVSKSSSEIDQIGIALEKVGVRSIEFFDSKRTLHMPIMGIYACGNRPCEYKIPVIKSPPDTALLGDFLEDSIVLFETKLKEYSTEIHSQMPEQGQMLVGIGVNDVANNQDVLGVVLSILEKYSIRPETVEVKTIPQDSISIPENRNWRLLRDSVEFRHIVDIRIMRFVRR